MRRVFIVIASIVLFLGYAVAQENTQKRKTPFPSITNAKWSEFKGMYDKSPLCSDNEITLWTCKTSSKTYSLCSSKQMTKNSGYLQYRAAKAGRLIFVFPASKMPPVQKFLYVTSMSGDASLHFSNGGYKYTLIDPLRGHSLIDIIGKSLQHGVEVACKNENQTLQLNYTMKLMYDAGIWQGY
jgi:hypothetical protein